MSKLAVSRKIGVRSAVIGPSRKRCVIPHQTNAAPNQPAFLVPTHIHMIFSGLLREFAVMRGIKDKDALVDVMHAA